MSRGVASDGSPVDVYLALPAGDTPAIINARLRPGSTILELGSGPGRITRQLMALGHTLVAVDNSPEMLAHIEGAEIVLGDAFELELDRAFDVVVAGSHLINTPQTARRNALLKVCRHHVTDEGVVLVERYAPSWAAKPLASQSQVGPVEVAFEPLHIEPGRFQARVTYRLDGRMWTQEFTAANVTDSMLETAAGAAGLRLDGWLNEPRTWAALVPSESSPL